MSDLISREELLKKAYVFDTQSNVQWVSVKDIKSMPSADVVEQKHGCWELINNDYIACSLCGEKLTKNRFTPYCDNCGASMTKGKSLNLGAKMNEVSE